MEEVHQPQPTEVSTPQETQQVDQETVNQAVAPVEATPATQPAKKKMPWLWIVLVIVVVLGTGFLSVSYFGRQDGVPANQASIDNEIETIPTPTPENLDIPVTANSEPTIKIDRDDLVPTITRVAPDISDEENYVYTSEVFTIFFEEYFEMSPYMISTLKLPQTTLDWPDAIKTNNELKALYEDSISKISIDIGEGHSFIDFIDMDYQTAMIDNKLILTVSRLVGTMHTSFGFNMEHVFIFDLQNKRMINPEELLASKGKSMTDLENEIKRIIVEYYQDKSNDPDWDTPELSDFAEQSIQQNTPQETLRGLTLNKNNKLEVLLIMQNFVGTWSERFELW